MLPAFATDNLADCTIRYAEFITKRSLGDDSTNIALADYSYLIFGHLRIAARFASRMTPFLYGVTPILSVCAKPQMFRVNARGSVAAMAHAKISTAFLKWNRTFREMNNPRESMSIETKTRSLITRRKNPVSPRQLSASPDPTAVIANSNFRKESSPKIVGDHHIDAYFITPNSRLGD